MSDTTVDLGEESVPADLLWSAAFDEPDAFQPELESGDLAFRGDELEVDCTANSDGATVWYPHTFPEDIVVEYTATCHEGEDDERSGRNLNLFFAAAGADGDPDTLSRTERTGSYGEYHELPNYIFTFTFRHSRMRRDPGFEQRSEFVVGAQPNHTYDVQVLKRGNEIAATVDGRLIHRWTDDDPHGPGWVGLRTWNSRVTYDEWAVYEV